MEAKFRIFIPGIQKAELAYLKGSDCGHLHLYHVKVLWLKSGFYHFTSLHHDLRMDFYSSMVSVKVYLKVLSTLKCKLLYFVASFH